MIGLFLLFIALYLYFTPKYRYLSYFLYIGFVTGGNGGFNLWTNSVVGFKQTDCALIYSIVIIFYLISTRQRIIPKIKELQYCKWFLAFILASFCFSILYYGLTPYEVLQGGRTFLLVLMLPVLIRIEPKEYEKVIKLMMWMCFITCTLYIGQIVLKRPLMPYEYIANADKGTGTLRFYNIPPNIAFFLSLTFLSPHFFERTKLNINIFRLIFIVAEICTLGRTGIAVCFFTVLLSMAIGGSFKKMTKAIIILGIVLTPFIGTISQRFESSNTNSDIERIMNGEFAGSYNPEGNGDATMLYRFAWVYERTHYLLKRPISEQFWGMGLCTESTDWPYEHYKFRIGLMDEWDRVMQLSTPDIGYGNLITMLGFGGTLIFLLMLVNFTRLLWKNRRLNNYITILSAMSLMMYISSFSSVGFSNPTTLVPYFLGFSFILRKAQNNNKQSDEI